MTLATLPIPRQSDTDDEAAAAALLERVPEEFLKEIGWQADRQVLELPMDHPLLGWKPCRVSGCGSPCRSGGRLCLPCERELAASGMDEDKFVARRRKTRRIGVAHCRVGCPRPAKSQRNPLCDAHSFQQKFTYRLPLEEFLARPDVVPLPSFGDCDVVACERVRYGKKTGFCKAHGVRWNAASRASPDLDREGWCRTIGPILERNDVVLKGLTPLARAQVLYGLHDRCRTEKKTLLSELRTLAAELREHQVTSVVGMDTAGRRRQRRTLLESLQLSYRRANATPASEATKDTWDLHVFGHAGFLHFEEITQPWLRKAAQRWAEEDLPNRRGDSVASTVQAHINHLVRLSTSLRLQRPDEGMDVRRLGRDDITAFTNRLAYLESRGDISANLRHQVCSHVRRTLIRMRVLGLTRPGKPLEGLAHDFALREEDVPDPVERGDEPGRALPLEVLRALCDALASLEEASGRDIRVATELLIDTGRRPDEICQLPWDCLRKDGDGGWVLLWDNIKSQRLKRELPITAATASLIEEQQKVARDRYPATSTKKLKLLHRRTRNVYGHHGLNDDWMTSQHRKWVDNLPPLKLNTGKEFPKEDVIPYAYRHTYAQRHADAGVPVDVLSELMDHDSLAVTQTYYRVGEKRRREAVDRLARHQLDRHGSPVWREVESLVNNERARHLRHAIGQVAVPFGACKEPSNVQAGGGACPFRWQCGGCDHFHTDPSYLPELRAYLDDLRRTKERVLAATGLDDWARERAIPSEEEISRIKNLIDRAETNLEQLSPTERAELDEAITLVRRGRRTVHLGMPGVRKPSPDLRLERP
ncbi:site-specific integrase [Streptomyces cinereoruber]|uniref:tyrosine-type recombinase/integrase n=1 Tax=Streptomyces cinereoruber TaxID=67260 RepID=UPI00345D64CF